MGVFTSTSMTDSERRPWNVSAAEHPGIRPPSLPSQNPFVNAPPAALKSSMLDATRRGRVNWRADRLWGQAHDRARRQHKDRAAGQASSKAEAENSWDLRLVRLLSDLLLLHHWG